MKKINVITKCSQCSYVIFDDPKHEERWGKYWCLKLNKRVAETTINKDCPLEVEAVVV